MCLVESINEHVGCRLAIMANPYPFWPQAWPDGEPPRKTAWIQSQPVSFVGGWEPLAFRQRAGFAFSDEQDSYYKEEYSDEALQRVKSLGCNHIVVPFTKGDGLNAIGRELDFIKDLVERAHRWDLRAGVYIRVDNIVPDTVRKDYPDVDEWLAVGVDEHVGTYEWNIQQTFRKLICYTHPSAVEWLEEVFRYAIEDIKADLLHLDGFAIGHTPWNCCRCPRCDECFRAWLRETYGAQRLQERFGIIQIDQVRIPEVISNRPLPEKLTNADLMLWHLHQWDKQLSFTRHFRRVSKSLGPDVAMSVNPSLFKHINILRWLLFDWKPIMEWVDLVWCEDPFHLCFDQARDTVVSRIGEFKRAQEHGTPLATYHKFRDDAEIEKSVSFTTAVNGLHPGCQGFSFRYLHNFNLAYESKKRFHEWLAGRWSQWAPTRPFGEVALLHHTASLAWNSKEPWLTLYAFEQILLDMKIAWRQFDQVDRSRLNAVRTLILPDAECLSDQDLDVIKRWVNDGGNLLFTQASGAFDEYGRRRPRHPIFDWVPAWQHRYNDTVGAHTWFDWKIDTDPQIVPFGGGRLGLWPRMEVDCDATLLPEPFKLEARAFGPENVTTPMNRGSLVGFLKALHGPFDFEVFGTNSVVVEVVQCANQSNTRLIHLVQTDVKIDQSEVVATMRDLKNHRFQLFSPDHPCPELIVDDRTARVRNLRTYAVLECEHRKVLP